MADPGLPYMRSQSLYTPRVAPADSVDRSGQTFLPPGIGQLAYKGVPLGQGPTMTSTTSAPALNPAPGLTLSASQATLPPLTAPPQRLPQRPTQETPKATSPEAGETHTNDLPVKKASSKGEPEGEPVLDGVAGLDAIVANARSRAHQEMQSLLQSSHKMMEESAAKQRDMEDLAMINLSAKQKETEFARPNSLLSSFNATLPAVVSHPAPTVTLQPFDRTLSPSKRTLKEGTVVLSPGKSVAHLAMQQCADESAVAAGEIAHVISDSRREEISLTCGGTPNRSAPAYPILSAMSGKNMLTTSPRNRLRFQFVS